jgi:ribonuclease-3
LIPSSEAKRFRKELKQDLGIRTRNTVLYRQAFRHSSAIARDEEAYSNERLEFLGDAILDAIISEHLYHHYPEAEEGFLTRMRSKLVSRERLNELAEQLGILRMLEHRLEEEKLKISGIGGDAVEALVGALYLDKGYTKTRDWVLRTLVGPLDIERLQRIETDPKSRLIEWAQKMGKEVRFRPSHSGDQHTAVLYVDDEEVGRGSARTKKKAEQEAARRFFESSEVAESP